MSLGVRSYEFVKLNEMRKTLQLLFIVFLLTSCDNSANKKLNKNESRELLPEPDKNLKEEYQAKEKLKDLNSYIANPDTSVVGIKIRNIESVLNVLGRKIELSGDSTHLFYSSDQKQRLCLRVHAGDFKNQVSIFSVTYSNHPKGNVRKIYSEVFETEKGIKLGLSEKQIVQKLGNSYSLESKANNGNRTIYYTIEYPNDSKTKILKTNNMPAYYAKYTFKDDKLIFYEFGFEYP